MRAISNETIWRLRERYSSLGWDPAGLSELELEAGCEGGTYVRVALQNAVYVLCDTYALRNDPLVIMEHWQLLARRGSS